MISPDVLDAMVASGCTAEQIAAAVKASMRPSTGAARQAAYRARQKVKQEEAASRDATVTDVTSRNVTVTDSDGTVSLSPVPLLSPTPPNNPLTPKPIPKTNSARGIRLPDDWTLSGPDLAYALSKGLSQQRTGEIFEKFCNWAWSASGPNAIKRNWHRAWQNWVLSELEKPQPRAGPSNGPPPGKGGFLSVLMDNHAERQHGTANFEHHQPDGTGRGCPADARAEGALLVNGPRVVAR